MNAGDKITSKKGKDLVTSKLNYRLSQRRDHPQLKEGTLHKATKTINFCCPGTPDLREQFKTFKVKIFQHGHLSFLSLPVKNSLFSTSFY